MVPSTTPKFLRALLPIISLLLSCTSSQPQHTDAVAPKPEGTFFNLVTYFNHEKIRLQNLDNLQKRVTYNGKTESKQLTPRDPSLLTDLEVFSKADINRPDWIDKFSVDTIREGNDSNLHISYVALQEKLPIRKMDIHFQQDTVSRLVIFKSSDSPLASFSQKLIYDPDSGFSILSRQKNKLNHPDSLFIEVNWNN